MRICLNEAELTRVFRKAGFIDSDYEIVSYRHGNFNDTRGLVCLIKPCKGAK